jgi:D-arabinose 1-dehydrogenase-like Zn-dependent alcohol dehydrogenase
MQCSRIRFPGLDGSDGGFAEYVRTSIRSVVRVPAGIDLVESAPLADAGLTAYHAVRRIRDSLGPGSVVVVVGAGGLGHLGIQFLRALTPSRIVAVDLRGELRDAAHRLGAETAYPPEDPHLRDWIRSETGGEGVDAVLDFVAEGDTPRSSLGLLRRGGTYSIVGYGGTLTVPTVEMVTRELRVLGNFVGTHEDLLGVLALAGAHQVRTTVRRYPLNEAPRAIEDLRSGAVVGRAVLTP